MESRQPELAQDALAMAEQVNRRIESISLQDYGRLVVRNSRSAMAGFGMLITALAFGMPGLAIVLMCLLLAVIQYPTLQDELELRRRMPRGSARAEKRMKVLSWTGMTLVAAVLFYVLFIEPEGNQLQVWEEGVGWWALLVVAVGWLALLPRMCFGLWIQKFSSDE